MMWLCILCWKSRSSMHHIPHLIFFLPFFFLFPSVFQFPFPIISLSPSHLCPLTVHHVVVVVTYISIRTMLKLRHKISKSWFYFIFFFHLSFVGNQVILYLFLLSNFRWRWIMKLWQTFCVISGVDVGIFMWGCWGHFVQFMFVVFCTLRWALFLFGTQENGRNLIYIIFGYFVLNLKLL